MSDWREVPLGQLGRFVGGGTPSKSNPAFWHGGNLPWVTAKDMKRLFIDDSEDHITEKALSASSASLVPANTILMVMRSGILRHSFPIAMATRPVTVNQDLKALTVTADVYPKYLLYALVRFAEQIRRTTIKGGTTVQSIKFEELKRFRIPVAPPNKQELISAKIDELFSDIDAGVRSTDVARRLLPAAHASLLDAAFSGLLSDEVLDGATRLPRGWRWTTLGDPNLTEIEAGLTKNPRRESLPSRLPYLRVANVYKNELRLDEIKTIGVTEAEARQKALRTSDLLVVEGNGSRDQIGRVALWDGSIAPVVHQNHIIRVRFGDAVNPHFALYWLMSARGRSAVVERASTTSGLYTLSKSKVASLPLPVTDRATQDRIVAVVDAELSRLAAVGRYVTDAGLRSEALRQSVLAAAFSGQLI